MIKYFCDRCGKEIQGIPFHVGFEVDPEFMEVHGDVIELCGNCVVELEKFLGRKIRKTRQKEVSKQGDGNHDV